MYFCGNFFYSISFRMIEKNYTYKIILNKCRSLMLNHLKEFIWQ
ncbi:MAG: hypothetical protein H6Q20_2558 [Bacteroidetes bacterium]|nr:hypothetical protein [Bacteroidota bacterium]